MKIKLTSVYVDDQDTARRFYPEVLGIAKKADSSPTGALIDSDRCRDRADEGE